MSLSPDVVRLPAKQQILALLRQQPDFTLDTEDIARHTGLLLSTTRSALSAMQFRGQVEGFSALRGKQIMRWRAVPLRSGAEQLVPSHISTEVVPPKVAAMHLPAGGEVRFAPNVRITRATPPQDNRYRADPGHLGSFMAEWHARRGEAAAGSLAKGS